jgi:hypothetical protein
MGLKRRAASRSVTEFAIISCVPYAPKILSKRHSARGRAGAIRLVATLR